MSVNQQFKGYQTKIGGKVAYVVNATETHLKVIFGHFVGYDGWNGGSPKAVYSFKSKKVWVKK